MNTLWTFGDSFTDFFYPPDKSEIHWRQKYIKFKGYTPKVYGEIIAEKLNLNLINLGMGGVDNSHILEMFCKVVDKIKEDDILIFGWTNQSRFRLVNKHNQWGHFNTEPINDKGFFSHKKFETFEFISENTVQELLINRTNVLYMLEIRNWIKLINFSTKNKIIHWTWCPDLSKCGIIRPKGYKSIKEETNGVVDDGHWCEDGHIEFADFLINLINKNINLNDFKRKNLI
jgi:hypothetical protein